jgi:hypothetical protein
LDIDKEQLMKTATLLLAIMLVAGCAGRTIAKVDSPAFEKRIHQYVEVRRAAAAEAGRLHTTNAARLQADTENLAAAIRERRQAAEEGDVFTADIAHEFRVALNHQFQGKEGEKLLNRVASPNPASLELQINDRYPADQPRSSMPHRILRVLPRLPDHLEYRFVGRDLVLLDRNAGVVVGILRQAIPELPATTLQ